MPDELAQHKRYAITRIKRATRLVTQADQELADAATNGTDALSCEAAREAEASIAAAHQAMAATLTVLTAAKDKLQAITADELS
jgi:hypothetical protein